MSASWARCAACGSAVLPESQGDGTPDEETFDFCSDSCAEWFEEEEEEQARLAREHLMIDIVQRYGAHMIGRLI